MLGISNRRIRPQLNVDIDLDLKRRLQAKLILEGKTLREWVEDMARRYLGEEPPAPADQPPTKRR